MRIIISMGDCNGIGLEILAKSIAEFDREYKGNKDIDFHVCGNENTMSHYYDLADMPYYIDESNLMINGRKCRILNCKTEAAINFGKEKADAGKLAAEAIETALQKTLKGDYDAFVTMPVSKAALYLGGWKYPGHTEMLAAKSKVDDPLMILCTRKIRVTLATIHEPLVRVPELLNKEQLRKKIMLFADSLEKDFAKSDPEIAVLGLNPHAGEAGSMGREELEKIFPAIMEANSNGIKADGPFPADGFFAHGEYKKYDGIIAMYHDQGLIPLKLLAKGAGVNFTGGLPIVRTSPDHGTAFAIAGNNEANHSSSLESIKMAVDIYRNRSK